MNVGRSALTSALAAAGSCEDVGTEDPSGGVKEGEVDGPLSPPTLREQLGGDRASALDKRSGEDERGSTEVARGGDNWRRLTQLPPWERLTQREVVEMWQALRRRESRQEPGVRRRLTESRRTARRRW